MADATRSPDVARVFETVERDSGAYYPKDLLDLTDEDFEWSWRVCGFAGDEERAEEPISGVRREGR
jgi:hypothetical protein